MVVLLHMCTTMQVSSLQNRNSELQHRLDQQRTDHANMLTRTADVTAKWQATVAENARLNAALGAATEEVAALQQLLLQHQQWQQQWHQQWQQHAHGCM
jgi:hypothetical protein